MEFEDLQKIWDNQNNRPMYVIDEAALHKRIKRQKNKTGRLANTNEIGMILIAAFTGGFLMFDANGDGKSLYSYVGGLAFLMVGLFVFFSRRNRKKAENRFDQSMLAELNQAIKNAGYLVNFARSFVWWFLLPASLFSFPNLILNHAPWTSWLLVSVSFCLSYLVVYWELNRVHIPRKKKLEALREKLTSEGESV
jgi:hypothetical protein